MTIAMTDFEAAPVDLPKGALGLTVTDVTHYTDRLFHFRTSRPPSFRFRSGEFVMIGLMVGGKPLYRAYSIASPNWSDDLEFFSIKVPDGPLTQHLQRIQPGDTVLMRAKSTGTLVHDALIPGKRLWMFSTGTGIAPFASLIRDPESYAKFDELILTQTCREVAELKFGLDLVKQVKNDEMLNELCDTSRLRFYATTTREPYEKMGRITNLIRSGELFDDLGIAPFEKSVDRAMICGSMDMLQEIKGLLEEAGLSEGANSQPGEFVIERAFVG